MPKRAHEDVPQVLDRRARELALGKERVPLTRLEFGLLEYLVDWELFQIVAA